LEKPAVMIKLTIEEEKGAKDKKTKTKREIAIGLSAKEKEKDKIYATVAGWPRVNAVDDAALKLARRPEYVYRNRKVLDIATKDLDKLRIQRGSEAHTLAPVKDTW